MRQELKDRVKQQYNEMWGWTTKDKTIYFSILIPALIIEAIYLLLK
jgi:hypothetical protein